MARTIKKRNSFTLVELAVAVAISLILLCLSFPALRMFKTGLDLSTSAEEIVSALRMAREKTLASENYSSWGVYFSTSSIPHQYALFKGADYSVRDISFDKIYQVAKGAEIFDINLAGAGQEIVFDRIEGTTGQSGTISLRLTDEPLKIKIIYVNGFGQMSLAETLPASDEDRIKDSRHIHFDYTGRQIDTAGETISLIFSNPPNPDTFKNILISDNLIGGQIYWEGEAEVNGEIQKIKIQTISLNSPDTKFCVFRDKRNNTKALTIAVSGDSTGNLIEYQADGQTAKGSSIYVSAPNWQ
ncbi:MAG: hypothetical protein V1705_02660 [bacterium]